MKTLQVDDMEHNSAGESALQSMSTSKEVEMEGVLANNAYVNVKPKTPLKKDELEKIARELKKKLTRASITAKQSLSPTNLKSKMPALGPSPQRPLTERISRGRRSSGVLSSSPDLYSPSGKSPTQWKVPAAIYLSSSPLKNRSDEPKQLMSSPMETRSNTETASVDEKKDDGSEEANTPKKEPQMILEAVECSLLTPLKSGNRSLKPSPPLSAKKQSTPTLLKNQLNSGSNVTPSILMRTPTQSRPSSSNYYNDEEGAGLLMYLATSPSPARPHSQHTPKLSHEVLNQSQSVTISLQTVGQTSSASKPPSTSSSSNSFMAPPLTPKRHINAIAKTPQGRQTPSANLFNNFAAAAAGLPSSGLSLTPAGFNMNDYVNFFTPSPSGGNLNHHTSSLSKTFLRTPDFNSIVNRQTVDGKMINFDKVELFGNTAGNSDTSRD